MTIALFVKSWRDHWKSLIAWVAVIVGVVAIQLSVYPTIAEAGESTQEFIAAFPEAFKGIFRIEDYTSGPGYLNTEVFSLVVPLVFIGIGAAWGASATAQEVERGSAEILFTVPVSRWRILGVKMAATLAVLGLLAALTFATIAIGAPIVEMQLALDDLLAATVSCALLGAVFSGIGFIIGAASSKNGVALGATAGVALLFFVFYSLDPLVDTFDVLTPVNPFQWALGTNPLMSGFDALSLLKLALVTVIAYAVAMLYFQRKDIPSR